MKKQKGPCSFGKGSPFGKGSVFGRRVEPEEPKDKQESGSRVVRDHPGQPDNPA